MNHWIDDPHQAPDVGLDVQLGDPALVMLGPPDDMAWGVYQNPPVWQLRDGRLVIYVSVSEDIRCNPDLDWPAHHLISSDDGRKWEPIEPDEAMIRESGFTLPDGGAVRQYGRPGHYLTFCADGRERPHPQDTCNNNNMIVTGDDRIMITYADFGFVDDNGRRRKAIYAREVIARPR